MCSYEENVSPRDRVRDASPARESSTSGISRRGLLEAGGFGILAGAVAAAGVAGRAAAQQRSGRTLLKGGTVITVDSTLGDFAEADVLIEGSSIAAVRPGLAANGADVIDASNMIVMPGFIDTHRHMWEGQLRGVMPQGSLMDYLKLILFQYGVAYRPEDVYIGNLISAVGALNAGVTTVLDWSHIQNTPDHTEAAIRALRESGLRAVFAYGFPLLRGKRWYEDTSHEYPHGLRRLRKQHFASEDQLLTLALAASGGWGKHEHAQTEWGAARDVGARITVHMGSGARGRGQLVHFAKGVKLGPDTTYVHANKFSDEEWKMIADSGGSVSISTVTETVMGMGMPPFQQALDHGIRPGLSVDVETSVPGEMFTQMRNALLFQRSLVAQRGFAGEKQLPPLITVRDAIEFATIDGARVNGLESKVGSLTPGKQADVIMLRKDAINVAPINDPLSAVVLGMDTSNVDTVFVAGKAKKRDGRLLDVDLKRIVSMAETSRDYLNTQVKRG